jgi:hypothetical protein
MVEPDNLEPALSRLAPRVDVVLRVDEEAVRVVGQIARGGGLDNPLVVSEQDAATLTGTRRDGMSHDGFESGSVQLTIHN